MKKNVGTIDKVVRVVIALIIVVLYLTKVLTGTLGIVLLIIGAVLLITSVISICPLYLPFGIRTNRKEKSK